MSKTLTISEKYSKYWPFITVISSIAAILSGIAFLYFDNVLLEGYLRLAAFVFFAIFLLSLFKLRDGKINMKFTVENHDLTVEYYQKNHQIEEEIFDFSDISDIKISPLPNRSFYNDLIRSDRCLQIKRKDSGWIYLNEINGRTIPLEENNALKVKQFLEPAIVNNKKPGIQ
jgi:hypothetical protein